MQRMAHGVCGLEACDGAMFTCNCNIHGSVGSYSSADAGPDGAL